MANRMKFKRGMCRLLTAAAILSALAPAQLRVEAATELSQSDYDNLVSFYTVSKDAIKYQDYLASHDQHRPETEVRVDGADFVRYEQQETAAIPEYLENYQGMAGTSVLTTEDSLIEYEFTVEQEGLYDLSLLYYPVEGKNSAIQRSIFLDGSLPYEELSLVEFQRIWTVDTVESYVNADGITVRSWEKDNQGNDLKPGCVEAPEWTETYLYDSEGYVTTQLSLYFTQGTHTVTLVGLREPLLIRELCLSNRVSAAPYSEVKAAWDAAGARDTSGHVVRIEAENATKTSSQMLYAKQDQSSPAVYPSSAKELLNNTIGGDSWRLNGQWIEWDFEVPEDGYYNIALVDKQNFVKGIYVSRRITIDGAAPFAQMLNYGFAYSSNWRKDILSDDQGDAYRFYLEEGRHTIRMEVVLGEFAGIISDVQDCVTQLNSIYRSVIRITGVAPDQYRDYEIERNLPELENQLIAVRQELDGAITDLLKLIGDNSDKEAVLITMRDQLDELIRDQERFTEVLSSYKVNVRATANWITQVISQPLQLDRLYVYSPDCSIKVDKLGFFAGLWHELCRLFYSFVIDYNQIGNVSKDDSSAITLWIGTGRDQANVIKSMIDATFTPQTGINVNVQLVDMNTLLRATLAGEGPDVAIQVPNTNGAAGAVLSSGNDSAVNYGIRNAVVDLTQFPDYEEVVKRFSDSAMVQLCFHNAAYGLPETQTFPMLFYRKDILMELGMEVPQTWDEVKVAMTVLAKNQMEFGMLPSEQVFAMLLYQNGGAYYSEDGSRSALDSDEAINTFKQYCEYYTDYKLDKETSVDQRFRTGECPIIIADYTLYNNLQVSAPDIDGLWSIAPVPGTRKEDGTIDRSVGSTGLTSLMMAATQQKEACWEFLKWWTSDEVQTNFGYEMESLQGKAGRVPTANLEAFQKLAWRATDMDALLDQYRWVRGIPQVPGGYYSWRNVNNAFYTVTTDTDFASPREELMDKVVLINEELHYKWEEFELVSTGKDGE